MINKPILADSPKPVNGALYVFETFGFKVFPLAPNSKVPPKGIEWKSWHCSKENIIAYSTSNPTANWAIDCEASNLTVLDLDCKTDDKNGLKSIEALVAQGNQALPVTLQVDTPSGGKHYFYQGLHKSTASKIAPGVDTRSRGGYVVCPGSKIDGKKYEINNYCYALPIFPLWLSDIVKQGSEAPIVLQDDVVIQEGNRTNTLVSLAGTMRRRGFSEDAILSAISVENDKLVPPLPPLEVKRIAHSVAKYSPELASTITDFGDERVDELGPRSLKDFQGEPPKRSWLINDWMPAGEISSLYGSGGSGKSLLSLQLAISVATGNPFLGLEVEHKMPVLAVYCEDTYEELHRRIHDIRRAPEFEFIEKLDEAPIRLWPRVGLSNDIARISKDGNDVIAGPFRKELEEQLKTMPPGPKLLILDTLSDIYLGDENVREKVNKFVKTHIGGLVSDFNLTILILAHPSRSGLNSKDMLSGSTAWENAVRNRLAFIPHEHIDDVMVLKRMKSNYAKRGEEILLMWNAGRFKIVEHSQKASDAFVNDVCDYMSDVIVEGSMMTIRTICEKMLKDVNMHHVMGGMDYKKLKSRMTDTFKEPVFFNGHLYSIYAGHSILKKVHSAKERFEDAIV